MAPRPALCVPEGFDEKIPMGSSHEVDTTSPPTLQIDVKLQLVLEDSDLEVAWNKPTWITNYMLEATGVLQLRLVCSGTKRIQSTRFRVIIFIYVVGERWTRCECFVLLARQLKNRTTIRAVTHCFMFSCNYPAHANAPQTHANGYILYGTNMSSPSWMIRYANPTMLWTHTNLSKNTPLAFMQRSVTTHCSERHLLISSLVTSIMLSADW